MPRYGELPPSRESKADRDWLRETIGKGETVPTEIVMTIGPVKVAHDRELYWWRCDQHKPSMVSTRTIRRVAVEGAQQHDRNVHQGEPAQGVLL